MVEIVLKNDEILLSDIDIKDILNSFNAVGFVYILDIRTNIHYIISYNEFKIIKEINN